MVTGKSDKSEGLVKEPLAGEVNPEPAPGTPEPQLPAPALTRAEVETLSQALTQEKVRSEKVAAGLNQEISKKDRKIKELEARKPSYNADALELVLKAAKGDMPMDQAEAALAQLKDQQANQQRQEEVSRIIDQKREEDKSKIIAAGLDPNDKTFRDYRREFKSALIDGDFSLADEVLTDTIDNLKAKGTTPKEEPPKKGELSEEEKAEIARQWMESQGLLTTHVGSPSKAFKNAQAKIDAYAKGDSSVSDADYKAACQEMGISI